MRKVLFKEGELLPNGFFVNPNAIEFDTAAVYPLAASDGHALGWVNDIRREGLDITGNVEIKEGVFDPATRFEDQYYLSAFSDKIEFVTQAGVKKVASGRLRGLYIHPILESV